MPAAAGRPDKAPWVSPYLTVRDAESALAFYETAFGFTRRSTSVNESGRIVHAELVWQEGLIIIGSEGAYGSTIQAPLTAGVAPAVSLYVYCPDADALFARAVAAGATPLVPPEDAFWGDRHCKVADPDGHHWSFATTLGCPED